MRRLSARQPPGGSVRASTIAVMCAAPAARSTWAAANSEAPLVITSSTSTTRRPRTAAARSGSSAKAPRRLRSRSARVQAALRAASRGCAAAASASVLRGASRRASSQRLVEAALAQPRRRQRHRQHQVGLLERRLDPGRAAQQGRERRGPAGSPRNLNCGDAVGPGPGIGARGQAGVERRRMQHAVAALRDAVGHRQRAGRAARRGRGEARHAGVAHRLRGPGAADRALARQAIEQRRERPFDPAAEHRLNILSAPWPPTPHSARRPSTPRRPRAGAGSRRRGFALAARGSRPPHGRPAAMDQGAAAHAGPTGRRCAAACEAHALVARRYRDAASFVIEPEAGAGRRRPARRSPRPGGARGAGRARSRSFDAPPEDGVDLLWANMALHMAADPQALIAQLASAGRDRRLPDVLLPRARHRCASCARCTGAWAGRRRPRVHRHARLGRHAGARRLRRAGDGHGAHRADLGHARGGAGRAARRWGATCTRRASRRCAARPGARRSRAALPELAPAAEGDGRIALTFEIIYGHAFKPAPRVALSAESAVSLREMRGDAPARASGRLRQRCIDPLQSAAA